MAKKKIKRFLKKAAPLLAVAGLGKAFMDSRRRNQANVELDLPVSNMFTRPNMMDIAGGILDRGRGVIKARPKMMTPQDMADDPMFLNAMAAKGGRIKKTKRGGKAVRGFGKKKKQANKMRKK